MSAKYHAEWNTEKETEDPEHPSLWAATVVGPTTCCLCARVAMASQYFWNWLIHNWLRDNLEFFFDEIDGLDSLKFSGVHKRRAQIASSRPVYSHTPHPSDRYVGGTPPCAQSDQIGCGFSRNCNLLRVTFSVTKITRHIVRSIA